MAFQLQLHTYSSHLCRLFLSALAITTCSNLLGLTEPVGGLPVGCRRLYLFSQLIVWCLVAKGIELIIIQVCLHASLVKANCHTFYSQSLRPQVIQNRLAHLLHSLGSSFPYYNSRSLFQFMFSHNSACQCHCVQKYTFQLKKHREPIALICDTMALVISLGFTS